MFYLINYNDVSESSTGLLTGLCEVVFYRSFILFFTFLRILLIIVWIVWYIHVAFCVSPVLKVRANYFH